MVGVNALAAKKAPFELLDLVEGFLEAGLSCLYSVRTLIEDTLIAVARTS